MSEKKQKANPMWGGRFGMAPGALMQRLNASIGFDKQLYRQDIAGSMAHAGMLAARGIITKKEANALVRGLERIEREIERGEFRFDPALEDIHMHIEARLAELIGDTAGKLHTARSRNDQVATDFRLYVREALDEIQRLLADLQRALLGQAEGHAATIMPGFTHLQSAQPVTLGHHLLAYVEMFGRDRRRAADARKGLNECPLGAAALAGTSFPIDRKMTAQALGFDAPMRNSMDAVSDRDFALEFLAVAAIVSVHLSRLAEELVLWSSPQFAFVSLPEQFTSGSSIMPQKRNPDAAELVRAKAGRIFGDMQALFTVMKGLPLAYNKDLQEDKEPVFDAHAHLVLCLQAMTGMVAGLHTHPRAMKEAAAKGFATATDLADWLVQNLEIPFRQAHHITGRIVKRVEEKPCALEALPLKEMQRIEPRITKDVFSVLGVEHAVKSRTSFGGTAPMNVKKAIREARKRYGV